MQASQQLDSLRESNKTWRTVQIKNWNFVWRIFRGILKLSHFGWQSQQKMLSSQQKKFGNLTMYDEAMPK
jgi:hypothetical protein